MDYSAEQYLHDEINLKRLVRRLEKSISDENWNEAPQELTFIKSQGTLQKVKHARKLLKNIDLYDADPTPKKVQQCNDLRITLDRVEAFVKEVAQRTEPKPTRPKPILPHIPLPSLPQPVSEAPSSGALQSSLPSSSGETRVDDLLLLPSDTPSHPSSTSFALPVPEALIPSTLLSSSTAAATSTGAAPRFLQNSSALQQELSDQLAQMATQLKRNAVHFSDSLAKDQAVVEETQQKLEGNFDVMQKERIRLRDHRGKSGSTTCLVVLIVLTVLLLFVLMVSIIRFT